MLITKEVFDLNTFGDVKIGIDYTPAPAFTSIAEAMAFYGNDEAAVLKALNEDKLSKEVDRAKSSTPLDQWHTFADDEETTLNGPANVAPVNQKIVGDLVLNIAKQHYGFSRGTVSKEANAAAKAKALEFIKANQALRGYLVAMSAGPSQEATS